MSLTQLKENIKTLMGKYKFLKGGTHSDVVFAKPVEDELFRLSNKVCGQGNDD